MQKKSSHGFTILEVMIGVSLAGVLAYFIAAVFTQAGKNSNYISQKTVAQQLQGSLGASLATGCDCQFYGLAAAGSIAPLNNKITAGCTAATPPLQSGQTLVQVGSTVPASNSLTVGGIKLTNFVLTNPVSNSYTATLLVDFAANVGANATVKLASLSIPMSVDTSAGSIIKCSSVGLSSLLWHFNPMDKSIYYSDGNVGVGTNAPSVMLDVSGGVRPGSDAAVTSCGSGLANGEGTFRYNYTTHAAEYCNGSIWTGMGGRPTLSNYVLLDANTAYTVTQDIGWHHACFITRINNGNCPNDCDYHVWPFPPGLPNGQGQFHWQMLVNGHVGEVDASCLDYP